MFSGSLLILAIVDSGSGFDSLTMSMPLRSPTGGARQDNPEVSPIDRVRQNSWPPVHMCVYVYIYASPPRVLGVENGDAPC